MDIDIRELLPFDAEELKRLKKRLAEEAKQGKIRDLEEKDFDNGVSYVRYYDVKDGTKHTTISNEEITSSSNVDKESELYDWLHEITDNGTEILTDPNDPSNVLTISWTLYDITNFRSEAGIAVRSPTGGEYFYEVEFDILEDGEIKVHEVSGNPEGEVLIKNGDRLQTIDRNGNLIDFEESKEPELDLPDLSGVTTGEEASAPIMANVGSSGKIDGRS